MFGNVTRSGRALDADSSSGVRGLPYAVDVADVLQLDGWLPDGSDAQFAAESLTFGLTDLDGVFRNGIAQQGDADLYWHGSESKRRCWTYGTLSCDATRADWESGPGGEPNA